MNTEIFNDLPFCARDPNRDCPETCPLHEEMRRVTEEMANELGFDVPMLKIQIRRFSKVAQKEQRYLNNIILKSVGHQDSCIYSEEIGKETLGFDE